MRRTSSVEIGAGREPSRPRLAGITDAAELLPDRRAVDAPDRIGRIERKPADIDQAPHGVGRKARAFFIGEGDQRQGTAGDVLGVIECFAGFKAGEHAVETVIATAGSDRVDVRAEHHRRTILAPGAHADDVADGVDGDRHAAPAHPLHEQVATGAILVAEREPAIAAARQGADPIEGLEPSDEAVEVDARRHPARSLSGLPSENAGSRARWQQTTGRTERR